MRKLALALASVLVAGSATAWTENRPWAHHFAELPIRVAWEAEKLMNFPPMLNGPNQVSQWSFSSGGSVPMVRTNVPGMHKAALELRGPSHVDWWFTPKTSGRMIVEAKVVVLEGLPLDLVAPFPRGALVTVLGQSHIPGESPVGSLRLTLNTFGELEFGSQSAGSYNPEQPFRLGIAIDIEAGSADAWIDHGDGLGFGQVSWGEPLFSVGPPKVIGLRVSSAAIPVTAPTSRVAFDDIVVRWVP